MLLGEKLIRRGLAYIFEERDAFHVLNELSLLYADALVVQVEQLQEEAKSLTEVEL